MVKCCLAYIFVFCLFPVCSLFFVVSIPDMVNKDFQWTVSVTATDSLRQQTDVDKRTCRCSRTGVGPLMGRLDYRVSRHIDVVLTARYRRQTDQRRRRTINAPWFSQAVGLAAEVTRPVTLIVIVNRPPSPAVAHYFTQSMDYTSHRQCT